MTPCKNYSHRRLAWAVAFFVAAGPAFAADRTAPTQAKEKTEAVAEQPATGGQAVYGVKLGAFFNDQHRQAARKAFAQRYASGKECPEGMERGVKGCAPPVAGRYWAVGQTLQSAVKDYPVPPPVASKLPAPPAGYRYALVGEDIVLMASGTKLVVDILEDITG